MSAFMQHAEHVRVLIWAALAVRRHLGERELYWRLPDHRLEVDDRKGLAVAGWSSGPQIVTREVTRYSADYIGQMLVDENARSLGGRYGDSMGENRYGFEYGRGPVDTGWTDREVMVAVRGYRYQSCEHDGWESSEAAQFCAALEQRLIARWTRDVTSSPWSIDETVQSEANAHRAAVQAEHAERRAQQS